MRRTRKKGAPDYSGFEKETANYFSERQKRLKIIATTRTPSGQTLDWVPIESQVPTGIGIASPPPKGGRLILRKDRDRPAKFVGFELEDPRVERGPRGTVPILRRTMSTETVRRTGHFRIDPRRMAAPGVKLSVRDGLLPPGPANSTDTTTRRARSACRRAGVGRVS